MKKDVIISLILVILILGSVIGMAIGTRPDTEDNNYPENPDENNNQVVQESYFGEIDAVVAETFPEIIIASKTTLFEKSEIEEDFMNISGVTRVVVEFNKLEDDDIIVIIRAIIDDTKTKEIYSEIQEKEYLTSEPIEFYKTARIDVNNEVIFNNTRDENKTIEYQFIDQRIDAIIGIETIKEDLVSGQLQAIFSGETIDTIMFYEITNLTSSPQLVMGEVTLDDFEWENDFLYSAKGDIDNIVDENTILELLNIEKEIMTQRENTVVYNQLNEISVEDINSEKITDIQYLETSTNITLVDLNKEEYLEVINLLEDYNFEKENITKEPTVNYHIISEGTQINDIKEKLEGLNLEIIETNKKIIFNIDEIEISGSTYVYSEETYETWALFPEDLELEEFEFDVFAQVSRDEILFLNLTKKEIEE
jgi:hypothetical protein